MAPVAWPASWVSALVCESLQPLQEIYKQVFSTLTQEKKIVRTTSAGLVLVAFVIFSAFWEFPVAVLTKPIADLKTPLISPRA